MSYSTNETYKFLKTDADKIKHFTLVLLSVNRFPRRNRIMAF